MFSHDYKVLHGPVAGSQFNIVSSTLLLNHGATYSHTSHVWCQVDYGLETGEHTHAHTHAHTYAPYLLLIITDWYNQGPETFQKKGGDRGKEQVLYILVGLFPRCSSPKVIST